MNASELSFSGKSLLSSKTVWGAAIASIPWMSDLFATAASTPGIPHALSIGLGALGTGLVVIGRILASKQITTILPEAK